MHATESIHFEELLPNMWSAMERLFGPNGACVGCWCMCWRTETYAAWCKIKGDGAKKAFMNLVQKGKAKGVLAFAQNEPIGWCSFGPRTDFPVLQRSKAYARDDVSDIWSITCFFIHHGWRRRGLARKLLKAAVEIMQKRGVKTIEAYPVTTTKEGRKLGSSLAWTGPLKIYEELGFKTVQSINPLRPLVRLESKKET